jgi:dienelactone hydrolase
MTTYAPADLWSGPVRVPFDHDALVGDLVMPGDPRGLVVFAHGSGSSRNSPRNQAVAAVLHGRGFATLLIDLLTPSEEALDDRTAQHRFDIPLLADRLVAILDWVEKQPAITGLPVGLFGASTGGGAALVAAARRPLRVAAVVSRGGRPDLAGAALAQVKAPTLLLVGGHDDVVIEVNREAMARMSGTVVLDVVPGATHLFGEPGALERVAEAAGDWFHRFLIGARVAHPRPMV